jgi:hypothetical protein
MKAVLTLALLAPFVAKLDAGKNVWTSLGPDGGSIQAIAIDPLNSSTMYAATGAGLFKSADAGASWTALKPGLQRPVP